jgi:hypothetical protein
VPDRDADGNLIRKAGIMGVVLAGGEIRPGNPIWVELPRSRISGSSRSRCGGARGPGARPRLRIVGDERESPTPLDGRPTIRPPEQRWHRFGRHFIDGDHAPTSPNFEELLNKLTCPPP